MTTSPTHDVDIFVAGAGPTGLAAANEAIRHGMTVKIVDPKPHRSTYSKALVAHARTLEAFEAMGVIDAVKAAGVPFSAMHVTVGDGQEPLRVDLMHLSWGDTRYPYWLSIPQFATERCLEEHLNDQGVNVDWNTSFSSFLAHDDHVEVHFTDAGDEEHVVRAKYLIGCDGGRSAVRQHADLPFERESIGETFVIADALGQTPMPEDEGSTALSSHGVIFLVPMPEAKRWRIIAHMPKAPEKEEIVIDDAFINGAIKERLGFDFGAHDISWTSQFVLKQGLAGEYRKGRVFIAGDAAHLHSPVGGQGLNTGVQDAHGLLWRIALAERSQPSHDALFDSYTDERRGIAAAMVKNTTLATNMMTTGNKILATVRGFVAKQALKLDAVQNQLGRAIGMLELSVAESPIVTDGPRGDLGPGDRMPNPFAQGRWLHELLDDRRHTVVIIGDDGATLTRDIAKAGIAAVHAAREPHDGGFVDDQGALTAAFGEAKIVVVRPDRTVAMTSETLDPAAVYSYARDVLGVDPHAL